MSRDTINIIGNVTCVKIITMAPIPFLLYPGSIEKTNVSSATQNIFFSRSPSILVAADCLAQRLTCTTHHRLQLLRSTATQSQHLHLRSVAYHPTVYYPSWTLQYSNAIPLSFKNQQTPLSVLRKHVLLLFRTYQRYLRSYPLQTRWISFRFGFGSVSVVVVVVDWSQHQIKRTQLTHPSPNTILQDMEE